MSDIQCDITGEQSFLRLLGVFLQYMHPSLNFSFYKARVARGLTLLDSFSLPWQPWSRKLICPCRLCPLHHKLSVPAPSKEAVGLTILDSEASSSLCGRRSFFFHEGELSKSKAGIEGKKTLVSCFSPSLRSAVSWAKEWHAWIWCGLLGFPVGVWGEQ